MKPTRLFLRFAPRAVVFGLALSVPLAHASEPKITFKKHDLDSKFRAEGVAVGDFNSDGKLDIAAGSVYYGAPDWTMHAIDEEPREFDPNGYSNVFSNFADDLNGDGKTDLVAVDFPGAPTWWWEQPAEPGGKWKKHTGFSVTNNESPWYVDLTGDGKKELVCSTQDKMIGNHYLFAQPTKDAAAPWEVTKISEPLNEQLTHMYYHGLGVGDVNGDKRLDVIIPNGWWEAPEDRLAGPWKFHEVGFGPNCAHMHAYDFDGDGDNDVLSSSAHDYGVWWHEQTGDPNQPWKSHEIAKDFSQSHSLCLADINGDGLMDFVTGKRWWAHGPSGDAGAGEPAVMVWFELQREDGKPKWIPHVFDHDSGVGTQFEVADLNGDGLLDVVTSNKKGVRWFQQVRE